MRNVEASSKLKYGSWECCVSMPFFFFLCYSQFLEGDGMCMAIALQEVSLAETGPRKQAFARGAREWEETCINEMSFFN
jgi:hypothetical protein